MWDGVVKLVKRKEKKSYCLLSGVCSVTVGGKGAGHLVCMQVNQDQKCD